MALVLVAASACAGGEPEGSAPTTVAPMTAAEAEAALVTVDQVRPLYGFGFDIREVPVLDPADVSLIALYGPCGTLHKTSYLTEGAHRVFHSTISLVVEVVAQPGEPTATGLLDSLAGEVHEGCPSFTEQVGGASSTVELIGAVDLPELGDQRLAWSQQVTAPDGEVGYRVVAVLREGPRLVVATVLLTSPIPPEAIADLATVMALTAFGPEAVPPEARSGVGTTVPGTSPPLTTTSPTTEPPGGESTTVPPADGDPAPAAAPVRPPRGGAPTTATSTTTPDPVTSEPTTTPAPTSTAPVDTTAPPETTVPPSSAPEATVAP